MKLLKRGLIEEWVRWCGWDKVVVLAIVVTGLAIGCSPGQTDSESASTSNSVEEVENGAREAAEAKEPAITSFPPGSNTVPSEVEAPKPEPLINRDQIYVDADYGFKVAQPGAGWRRGGPGMLVVAGELCRIWSTFASPSNCIMIVVQRDQEPTTAEQLLESMPGEFVRTVGAVVQQSQIITVSDRKAVSILAYGKGSGVGIDGRGRVDTVQRWVAIPRGRDLLMFIATAAASEFPPVQRVFDAMMETVEVGERGAFSDGGGKLYVDIEYGFKVPAPGEGWERGGPPPGTVYVPGELCRAWSMKSDPRNVIAVFIQKTEIAPTPRYLLDKAVETAQTSTGAEVVEKWIGSISGMNAMSLLLRGRGTGGTIDGTGEVLTSQHWIAIPRKQDIVCFLATGPAATFDLVEAPLKQMLAQLEMYGFQTQAQRVVQ